MMLEMRLERGKVHLESALSDKLRILAFKAGEGEGVKNV